MEGRNMRQNKIRTDIVIIDSGVESCHSQLKEVCIKGIEIVRKDGFRVIEGYTDEIGHGTAVCGILHKHAPAAEIFVIKIGDRISEDTEEYLLFALEYILTYIDCKVVNISMGVDAVQNGNKMQEVCSKLKKRNINIFSAFDNNGAVSYPAALENVYGVEAHESCKATKDIGYYQGVQMNLCAYGNSQRVLWKDGGYIISGGNSYACAHAAGLVTKALLEDPDMDIDSYIKEIACFSVFREKTWKSADRRVPDISAYKRVALYPFNKEMHSLIRFEEYLPFSITVVYDTRYSARVRLPTSRLLHGEYVDHVIEDIEEVAWDRFDTLIVGHTFRMEESLGNKIIKAEELIKEALGKGHSVYSFDDYSSIFAHDIRYFTPALQGIFGYQTQFYGKLHQLSKPVIGVFGTSSKQGKFTLQLYLRYLFQQKDYTVAQLGSEPTAGLFGMDACYHFGYGAGIKPSYETAVAYLNEQMKQLEQLGRDLILVGCQSNSIPYEMGNIKDLTFPQLSFLWGTMPDIILLCINPYDDVSYILQTKNFLESAAESKVLAAVFFPMDIQGRYEGIYGSKIMITMEWFKDQRERLEKEIHMPVFYHGDMAEMDNLVNLILEYL